MDSLPSSTPSSKHPLREYLIKKLLPHPSGRVQDTWRLNAKLHLSYSGDNWLPKGVLTHFVAMSLSAIIQSTHRVRLHDRQSKCLFSVLLYESVHQGRRFICCDSCSWGSKEILRFCKHCRWLPLKLQGALISMQIRWHHYPSCLPD